MGFDISNVRFNIIHHRGQPNVAYLDGGIMVQRQEKVFIREMRGFVRCADYDNHFCFLFPEKDPKRFPYFAGCSCGSMAVVIGSNVYKGMNSPVGAMLVCYHHMTYHKHADGSS